MTGGVDEVWRDAIRQREQLLGEGAVRRMAEMFIEEVDPLLDQAVAALKAGRADAARQLIHHLGGSAGCLDFSDLVRTFQDAEHACIDGRHQEALQQMMALSPLARSKAEQLRRHFRLS